MNEIVRIPILGIKREPIIGLPPEGGELKWDDIYSSLVNYIKYAAKQVSGQYGTFGAAASDDLFQEGQLLLYQCFTIYKQKPMNQFSPLFKASLWRKLRDIAGKEQKQTFGVVDIEEAYDIGYSDSVVEDIYEEYKLQQAAELLESTPIALTILKEFVNPSTRTLWEVNMDVARKSMLKTQGKSVAIPKTMNIKGIHIQRALEIPKTQFTDNFKLVKDVISRVFLNEGSADDILDEEVECILQVAM